jgi:hypothetical protein
MFDPNSRRDARRTDCHFKRKRVEQLSQPPDFDEYPAWICDPVDIEFLVGWETACESWLLSPEAIGYPGGNRNRWLMYQAVNALGLQEASDKQNALTTAFQKLQAIGMLSEREDGFNDAPQTEETEE